MRVFELAHEVCHLANWGAGELAADCCAVQRMRAADYLPTSWLLALVEEVQAWPKDPNHPSGTVRAAHIMECAQ